jgi:hypothetical protein
VAVLTLSAQADARIPDDSPVAQPAGPGPLRINQYDWNMDGCDDLIVRNALGFLYLYRGTCSPNVPTQFQDPVLLVNQSYSNTDVMLLPGDLDGDMCPDLLARVAIPNGAFDGSLYVRFGDCNTGVKGDSAYVPGFGNYDWFAAPGTWEGSSCPNILARTTTSHELHIFQSNCTFPGLTITDAGTMAVGWEGFDWMMAPSRWDGDNDLGGGYYCGDILTRQASNASLQWYDGDCDKGFSGSGATQVGTSWGIFDWILSGGNWSGDLLGKCPDVLARRSDDGTLRLYSGNCTGGFGGANIDIGGATDWRQFDYILGDSGPVVPKGPNPTVTLGATPSPTPTATPTATPTPTAPTTSASVTPTTQLDVLGDTDCDGDVDAIDALNVASEQAGFDAAPCIANGDVNCSGDRDTDDMLAILGYVAALPPEPEVVACGDIGEPV